MLVSSVDYSSFVGRIGVGKITAGTIKQNMQVTVCDYHNPDLKTSGKITALYQYDGLKKSPVDSATVGDIVAFSGIESITIGNTICDPAAIIPIPFVKISEPTIEMTFSVNDSPFAGKEGKFVTSRQIRDRLYRELLKDVSLHVKDTDSTDSFRVWAAARCTFPSSSRRCAAKGTNSRWARRRCCTRRSAARSASRSRS